MADLAGDDVNHVVVLTVPVASNRPIRLDARYLDRRAAAVVMPCNFTACDEEGRPPAAQASEVLQAKAPRGLCQSPRRRRLTQRILNRPSSRAVFVRGYADRRG